MSFAKVLAFLGLIFLNGCVGITDNTNKKVDEFYGRFHENDPKEKYPYLKDEQRNKVGIKEAWGEPLLIAKNAHGGERWIYPDETFYKGIIVWAVVIPIPLKFPLGDLNVLVDFEQDNVKTMSRERIAGDTYACGPGVWIASALSPSYENKFCWWGE
ncbi:hypothetical protein [Enterovibrio sp. 27052020O]|uniref:hypothetical protein n=1 Tax=Enterovibrio sp. 27052020O TaxID=3241166 RepID=UPI00388D6ADC